ncbi:MAG: ABC transporter permease [Clostridiales bacterium]|nr:ABC transporter permease [Clostridiales bacterium]
MVKTYLKTLVRVFKKQFTRLLSIIFMVVISVGFVAGIGGVSEKIDRSLTDYYRAQNVSDFIVKSKTGADLGAKAGELKALYGENNVNAGFSLDVDLDLYGDGKTQLTRLYFLEEFGESQTVNKQTVRKSGDPAETYAYAEEGDNKIKGVPVGMQITLDFKQILSLPEQMPEIKTAVTVTKTVLSPLTFGVDGEPSYENGEIDVPDNIQDVNKLITVDNILYLPYSVLPAPIAGMLPKSDLYIALDNRGAFDAFGDSYKSYINAEKVKIEEILGGESEARFISLYDNYSFSALKSYGDKVRAICYVLMVAFLLVTALVVLSTMTRLIEEERAQVACLSTLGYPAWRIIFKYVLFAMIGCGIGGAGAYFVELGVVNLLYFVFNYSFTMPPMSPRITPVFYLVVFFGIVIVTLVATVLAGRKLTGDRPANLLRPKAPKAGKKVFLERIPLIWNLLSFKYKSTTRNVLRYLSRFLMTVVAVAFSTALVMAGLALLDLCLFHGINSPSVMAVAVVVVIFAGLLTAVVIYTLTNINISERNREIATLMVLGYQDREVTGYIYREVYIDTAVGIVFGYPFSALLIWAVFTAMGMGTLGGVSWFVWLLAPFVVLAFTAFVTLLLRRKILKIDMNESLKAIE